MRTIRRAAVTGLMAVWLAPLSAFADAGCAKPRSIEIVLEDQRGQPATEASRQDELREARRRLLRREG
ncbi:hypothetical protein [Falsiroseomonas sp.]|uniref:hypothetical protein n=1 Tax=Falsiroseomonas sp. TaxID=2870721 RepID=UPI002721B37A|nr:hypothetical protein [Falsiroseomonas sp.]MDO9503571.1 hypothetical protein [Falsiroseomonas sp.]MDP3418563.1 hypothetical protein [Falsiroseomonas sp.]